MAPGKFTELFFLDEATALAAGHRPCGERQDYAHLAAMWAELHPGRPGADADAIDERLDGERRNPSATAPPAVRPPTAT
jgi:hypothetical protein